MSDLKFVEKVKANCTGCFACANICPKNAISMCEQEIGHIYPKIDNEKCINCGLCENICPAVNSVNLNYPKDAYAAWAKDTNEHRTSTSGGAAAVFTNFVLENGGVVYGSVFDKKLIHKRIDNFKDAVKLKGSKYIHSHIENTYKSAKEDLENSIPVLFVGTPCQIAGLKAFLGEKDYENLITVDLICHGVPPQKLFFESLEHQGIKQQEISEISFRDNLKMNLTVKYSSDKIYKKSVFEDLYYMAFYDELIHRESCYTCKYTNAQRVSDITVGDFWGLGKEAPFDEKVDNGISVILVNTGKGQDFLNKCQDKMNIRKRTVSEAVAGNLKLRCPSSNKNHARFARKYEELGLEKALKKFLIVRRIKFFILKKILKK